LSKDKVRAGEMVIVDIRRKDPPLVDFIENDDMRGGPQR